MSDDFSHLFPITQRLQEEERHREEERERERTASEPEPIVAQPDPELQQLLDDAEAKLQDAYDIPPPATGGYVTPPKKRKEPVYGPKLQLCRDLEQAQRLLEQGWRVISHSIAETRYSSKMSILMQHDDQILRWEETDVPEDKERPRYSGVIGEPQYDLILRSLESARAKRRGTRR